MKYAVIAGTLSLFSITAVANETAGLSYDYVEAGYAKMDEDGYYSPSYDGFIVNFSKQFAGNWYFAGSYSQGSASYLRVTTYSNETEYDIFPAYITDTYIIAGDITDTYSITDDIDLTRYSLGFGYIQHFSDVTSFDYALNYGQLKVKSDATILHEREYAGDVFYSSKSNYKNSDTSDFFAINAQVRHLLTDKFEVNAGLGYERLHDEESDNNLVLKVGFNYTLTEKGILGASYRYVDEYADIAAIIRYYF